MLDRYLTLAPFGGNLEGVRAASLAYFGKEPRKLTIGEAALLVALPQSPEARRPDRFPDAARAARARVLDRALARGVISAEEAEAAKREPIPDARKPLPMLAAHAAEEAVAADPDAHVIKLSIDARLQAKLEALALEARHAPRRRSFRPRSSRSTIAAARCARASAPPIISTRRAAARSTCRARRARRARR